MASILDNAVLIDKEVTYGTLTGSWTDAIEAQADTVAITRETIESVGMRGAMQAQRSDRVVTINMGAEGSLQFDVLNKGFGFLLQGMLGTVSGPTQEAATAAYTTTCQTSSAETGDFFSVQVQRTDMAGNTQAYTHHGGTITGWNLSHDVGGNLNCTLNFDFEDHDTATGAGTPVYPSAASPFDWSMASFTIDGNNVCSTSFSLDGDLAMKTDRRCMRGSALKKQPVRSGIPTFGGTLDIEYEGQTIFDLYPAGATVPIVGTWTGATIEGAHNYEIVMTMAACLLEGSAPVVSLTDIPMINVPFRVLDNSTDPAISITCKSTDTAL